MLNINYNEIRKWINNGNEAIWLAVAIIGCVGCFFTMILVTGYVDEHIGHYTAGCVSVLWMGYMFSIFHGLEDLSKWWIINAFIWTPLTIVVTLGFVITGVIKEIC